MWLLHTFPEEDSSLLLTGFAMNEKRPESETKLEGERVSSVFVVYLGSRTARRLHAQHVHVHVHAQAHAHAHVHAHDMQCTTNRRSASSWSTWSKRTATGSSKHPTSRADLLRQRLSFFILFCPLVRRNFKERKKTHNQGRDGRTARRHHTGI